MKYSNEEATIAEAKALHVRQSRRAFYCGMSMLQFRRELFAVSQYDSTRAMASNVLLNLSIAHCSNCSSVISAVGGTS